MKVCAVVRTERCNRDEDRRYERRGGEDPARQRACTGFPVRGSSISGGA